MRVLFVTFGRGAGDLVLGLSIHRAMQRIGSDAEWIVASNCELYRLVEPYAEHLFVPAEPQLLFRRDDESVLYATLRHVRPDLLVVNGVWLPFEPLLHEIDCPTLFLCRKVPDWWFRATTPSGATVQFDPARWDWSVSIEPGFQPTGFDTVPPVLLRNHDEILTRVEARDRLRVPDGAPLAVIAQNGLEGELDSLRQGRDDCGYHVISTTNHGGGGLFPLVDFAAGIDLLVGGGGYNLFYESRYFGVPAQLTAFERLGDDQKWRLEHNASIEVTENGADRIAAIITKAIR